jgi:hypothetical protein
MAVEGTETVSDPAVPPRLFSLEEANALLPSLVPILTRLRDNSGELLTAKLRLAALLLQGPSVGSPDRLELVQRVEALEAAIDEDGWMLQALGVELKVVQQGLVDFPTLRDGRVVYLCWCLGEGSITHWHEVDAGFAGRQPL